MLCGPDDFFKKAKHILPWDDEPGEHAADTGLVKHIFQHSVVRGIACAALELPTEPNTYTELSPCSPLNPGWDVGPRSMGVSVTVVPPSTVANKIFKHCKDCAN